MSLRIETEVAFLSSWPLRPWWKGQIPLVPLSWRPNHVYQCPACQSLRPRSTIAFENTPKSVKVSPWTLRRGRSSIFWSEAWQCCKTSGSMRRLSRVRAHLGSGTRPRGWHHQRLPNLDNPCTDVSTHWLLYTRFAQCLICQQIHKLSFLSTHCGTTVTMNHKEARRRKMPKPTITRVQSLFVACQHQFSFWVWTKQVENWVYLLGTFNHCHRFTHC